MPELPEIETIMEGLKIPLVGCTIKKAVVYRRDMRIPIPDKLETTVKSTKIISLARRSKYLLIRLENGMSIICHLGMSGQLRLSDPKLKQIKHTHVVFSLSSGEELRFSDPRRFGLITLCNSAKEAEHSLFANLGVEPLEHKNLGKLLYDKLKHSNSTIKCGVMNSHIIVGVGNIYACEALFDAQILPKKKCKNLTKTEYTNLGGKILQVLEKAIIAGGSTLKDYVKSDGKKGYFQHSFKVYSRENKPCKVCNKPIEKIVLAGRSSFFCSNCQK